MLTFLKLGRTERNNLLRMVQIIAFSVKEEVEISNVGFLQIASPGAHDIRSRGRYTYSDTCRSVCNHIGQSLLAGNCKQKHR